MAPFRMPFSTRKGPITNGLEPNNDENARPGSNGAPVGKESVALGSKAARDQPNEYKMSRQSRNQTQDQLGLATLTSSTVVNDSGIYLPPSPTEKKSFWHRTPTSTTSSNHRSLMSDSEPFSISRESFESYRRSFDISGRSPVLQGDSFPSRASLDSRAMRLPRSSVNGSTFEKPQSTEEEEEGFEDVGLQDEPKPKKKSFLSRFGESPSDPPSTAGDTSKSHFTLHLPGRKRGQSGQGAELGHIERPGSKGRGDGIVR